MAENETGNDLASRRTFLRNSVAAGTLLALGPAPRNVHAAGVDETLRVGLVGCGGRGTQAATDALAADPNAKLVAIADTFVDRANLCLDSLRNDEEFGSRIDVDQERTFTDFEGYKKVVDAVDVVLLATPPHFRPEHLRYAVEQGKHVFVEKPVAVDAPGVRNVMESCRIAKDKGLSVVSGLCWRYDLGVRETMRRILEERAIGDIISIESSYNSGTLWHRGHEDTWSEMEYQIRNWLYFTWLSGDHILEQAVHSIDKTAWLLGDISPVSAMAMGGRQQRTDPKFGHIYDHFTVFYEYPTGQRVYFTCRQQDDTTFYVDETVLGTQGQARVLANHITNADGKQWRYRGPKPSMYRVEHEELFKSIRDGAPINNGDYMCNSTMIGIMGRMAAYSGKTLTWDECFNSDEKLGPASYAWGDAPHYSVPIPGQSWT